MSSSSKHGSVVVVVVVVVTKTVSCEIIRPVVFIDANIDAASAPAI